MTIRYSKKTGTFYPLELDYGATLPSDVVMVEQASFDAAMARPDGSSFGFSASGALIITAPPVATPDQLKAPVLAQFRADREQFLNRLTGIEAMARVTASPDLVAIQQALATVGQGLLDMTAHPTVVAAIDAATCKAAMKSRYVVLLAGVPAAVVLAFSKAGA